MSGRLADVGRRIATVRQLGAVVNAMRGIAGTRAQQARALLPATRSFAETAVRAIAQARRLEDGRISRETLNSRTNRRCRILFGAEQGFAGAFPEQVLDAAADAFEASHVFLIGSRTKVLAAERGLTPAWSISLPNRAAALSGMANVIAEALYAHLAEAGALPVTMVYPIWTPGHGITITWRNLLPFDPTAFPADTSVDPPLISLPVTDLIQRLGEEYIFAQICEAAIEAFAAENEARMATMAAAKSNIEGKLAGLQLEERLTRQEDITAEVIELAASARFHRRG